MLNPALPRHRNPSAGALDAGGKGEWSQCTVECVPGHAGSGVGVYKSMSCPRGCGEKMEMAIANSSFRSFRCHGNGNGGGRGVAQQLVFAACWQNPGKGTFLASCGDSQALIVDVHHLV